MLWPWERDIISINGNSRINISIESIKRITSKRNRLAIVADWIISRKLQKTWEKQLSSRIEKLGITIESSKKTRAVQNKIHKIRGWNSKIENRIRVKVKWSENNWKR